MAITELDEPTPSPASGSARREARESLLAMISTMHMIAGGRGRQILAVLLGPGYEVDWEPLRSRYRVRCAATGSELGVRLAQLFAWLPENAPAAMDGGVNHCLRAVEALRVVLRGPVPAEPVDGERNAATGRGRTNLQEHGQTVCDAAASFAEMETPGAVTPGGNVTHRPGGLQAPRS
jgi:hypothetical protein